MQKATELQVKEWLTSLSALDEKGVLLTRRAVEGLEPWSSSVKLLNEVFRDFQLWKHGLKTILRKVAECGLCNDDFLYEGDGVPDLKGGIEYGDPMSARSQRLFAAVREATMRHLEKMRAIASTLKSNNGGRYTVVISPKRGIYIPDGPVYAIGEMRRAMVLSLDVDPMPGAKIMRDVGYKDTKAVGDAVADINRLFKKTLGFDEPLIKSEKNGYWLNHKHYNIRREDDSAFNPS